MAKAKLSDKEAKVILRKWPERTKRLWKVSDNRGFWIRAQPKALDSRIKSPALSVPGSKLFRTQPDGMWAYFFDREFCDIVCIEVCGTIQNLNDKRSRYFPASHSLMLICPHRWLWETIGIQRGGQIERWKACRSIVAAPKTDLTLPVRLLRVLYSLPKGKYVKWRANHVPTGYEYYCRHSSMDTYKGQSTQKFLAQMSAQAHFLTAK